MNALEIIKKLKASPVRPDIAPDNAIYIDGKGNWSQMIGGQWVDIESPHKLNVFALTRRHSSSRQALALAVQPPEESPHFPFPCEVEPEPSA